ncbi:MAG TPA: hypothetical protein VGR30_16390 [Candidatus Binatia bacterium]|jgi:hypothetical protein|nr:hypothetical protein [Candidatus Binatia bacterium]
MTFTSPGWTAPALSTLISIAIARASLATLRANLEGRQQAGKNAVRVRAAYLREN